MLSPFLGPSSQPDEVAQPDEKYANIIASVCGMTDTEHTTSGSNEEELLNCTYNNAYLYNQKSSTRG